jgi:hypothetical protein
VRRVLLLGALLSGLPTVLALVVVRPAAVAAEVAAPVYDQVAQTAVLAGVRTDGVVGASGGLVTLDTGSAYVTARLDSSPSAQVLAAPGEPGTLTRTLAGQVNGPAGTTVVDVPDAEARYPGAQTKASYTASDPVQQPPLRFGTAAATAEVGAERAAGSASAASFDVAGVLAVGPSTSTVTMTSSPAAGTAVQVARTAVSSVDVAGGLLRLDDVVATAGLKASRDSHAAVQDLTIGGASVAGQAVAIGNDGVTAIGTALLPGQTLADATAQANARLAAAGVAVHTVGGRTTQDARSATADTGGVQIGLQTPALPGGVSANTLTVVVGGIALTELDTLAVPEVVPPAVVPPATGGTSTGTTTTTFVPGTPGVPGGAGVTPPQVLGPVAQAGFVVHGRPISAQTALIGFAGWQFLSLGTATLYGFVERRRRLALLEQTP